MLFLYPILTSSTISSVSTFDLKSALKVDDRIHTTFGACGGLYQFTPLPFGVTNGVACFQRITMQFVEKENLTGVFP